MKTAAQPRSVVTPTPPPQCSIALWQGYVSAQFYARDSNGGEVLVFSPTFRTWRLPWQPSVPIRDDPRALAALETLKSELRSRGWARMRRKAGSDWYECRFRFGRRHGELDGAHRLTAASPIEPVET
jgi:hypothetical protein